MAKQRRPKLLGPVGVGCRQKANQTVRNMGEKKNPDFHSTSAQAGTPLKRGVGRRRGKTRWLQGGKKRETISRTMHPLSDQLSSLWRMLGRLYRTRTKASTEGNAARPPPARRGPCFEAGLPQYLQQQRVEPADDHSAPGLVDNRDIRS